MPKEDHKRPPGQVDTVTLDPNASRHQGVSLDPEKEASKALEIPLDPERAETTVNPKHQANHAVHIFRASGKIDPHLPCRAGRWSPYPGRHAERRRQPARREQWGGLSA